MNLTPEVAAVLRQALAEADRLTQARAGAWAAYGHLCETIGNLLEPVYAAEADQQFGPWMALPAGSLPCEDESDLPF